MKRLLLALLLSMGMGSFVGAQVTVPNTLVAGTTITAAGLNTNFTTIANHALDRLSGGNIAGNITADALVTFDGVDVGVQACITCTPTFAKLTLTNTSATSLTVGGGLTVGTGSVALVTTAGKITAISSTYFASLSGANLSAISGANFTVPAGNAGQIFTSNGVSAPAFAAGGAAPGGASWMLLKAAAGTSTAAGATVVDSIAVSGLTTLDRLVVYYTLEIITQSTTNITLYDVTDSVVIADLTDQAGSGAPAIGSEYIASVMVAPSQASATRVFSVVSGFKTNNAGVVQGAFATPATAFTGSWTVGLRHGGVTAGGTLGWRWAVYRVLGQ